MTSDRCYSVELINWPQHVIQLQANTNKNKI